MIHIYCGDGKGKTTASIGLAIRCCGAGMKVHFVQFMKGGYTSELEIFKLIPNLTFMRCDRDYGFTFNMTDNDKKNLKQYHNNMIKNAFDKVNREKIDMLILDEFNTAYYYNLISHKLSEDLIFNVGNNPELILTGRNPDEKFLKIADYISEINAVKHPYKKGITARKGIEF